MRTSGPGHGRTTQMPWCRPSNCQTREDRAVGVRWDRCGPLSPDSGDRSNHARDRGKVFGAQVQKCRDTEVGLGRNGGALENRRNAEATARGKRAREGRTRLWHRRAGPGSWGTPLPAGCLGHLNPPLLPGHLGSLSAGQALVAPTQAPAAHLRPRDEEIKGTWGPFHQRRKHFIDGAARVCLRKFHHVSEKGTLIGPGSVPLSCGSTRCPGQPPVSGTGVFSALCIPRFWKFFL